MKDSVLKFLLVFPHATKWGLNIFGVSISFLDRIRDKLISELSIELICMILLLFGLAVYKKIKGESLQESIDKLVVKIWPFFKRCYGYINNPLKYVLIGVIVIFLILLFI